MINYILQGSIFITAVFLLFMIIRPTSKGGGQIALLISGLLLYALNSMQAKLGDSFTPYLWGIFILVFLSLSVLFLTDKKMDSKISFGIVYFIFMFAAFIVTRGCYFDDKNRKDSLVEKDNEIIAYKKQYDFNVDSLLLTPPTNTGRNKKNLKLKFPIIVYRKWDNKTSFDYEFNKSLERNLTSFSYDSLNTIIILENNVVDIGTYTNGKTKAQKIETTIRFLNKQTMKEIASTTLTGGEPPSSITYRRSSPESRSGSAPTSYEIIETIKNELQSTKK